jgi:hypothetical protein
MSFYSGKNKDNSADINAITTQVASNTSSLAESAKKTEGTKSLKEFGAKGNANYYDSVTQKYYEDAVFTIQAANDTQAIKDAVAYSKSTGARITVPVANYLFTEQINFDGKVSFVGQGNNYSATFLKHFAGHGFFITKDRCELLNISVFASEGFRGLNTGSGVVIGDDEAVENVRANWCKIDIFAMYHGEHGIDCRKGNECIIKGNYDQNRTDGVHCESQWAGGAADWNANNMEFSAMGNGRHGLYIYGAETNMLKTVVQGNGWRDASGVGAYINWSGNSGFIYAEGNVNGQVTYGVSGYGNNISMHTVDQNPSFQNHKNVGYVNVTGTGLTGFYKYFYAQIQHAVTFNINSSGTIPANNFVDFSTNTAYGITNSSCLIQISPSVGLPQGLTYEVFYASSTTIKLRIHNNTNADILLGSTIVWRGKAELLI